MVELMLPSGLLAMESNRMTRPARNLSETPEPTALAAGLKWFFHLICIAVLCLPGTVQTPVASAEEGEIPEWLQERMAIRTSFRRDNGDMISLVSPLADKIGPAVVQVVSDGKPVDLGVVVASDGYVLTKRSELSGDPIRVRLADGRMQPARVAAVRRSSDLAILRVEGLSESLPTVTVVDALPPVGSFLISVGRGGVPVGLGVVGVGLRKIDHQGRLGVVLDDLQGQATVRGVWPDSGADAAGVVPGDRIVAINGLSNSNRSSIIEALRKFFPGEDVHLTIVRDGAKMEKIAKIREFGLMQESENDSKVNGPRSARLSGFEQVIQHDTVLNPDECGGPVIDTQGRFVGLNIARAGRVVSYALPASIVIGDLTSMLNEARSTTGVAP
jgi:S1-C subfamily serine protease